MSSTSARNLGNVTYDVRLSPRAESQLQELPAITSAVVKARISRLAARTREQTERTRPPDPVQGHLLGRTFRALYEVDHDEGTVTVLDVAPRT